MARGNAAAGDYHRVYGGHGRAAGCSAPRLQWRQGKPGFPPPRGSIRLVSDADGLSFVVGGKQSKKVQRDHFDLLMERRDDRIDAEAAAAKESKEI